MPEQQAAHANCFESATNIWPPFPCTSAVRRAPPVLMSGSSMHHPRPRAQQGTRRAPGVQVDVLITVSGFCTMPTLSTAVAARFGMRSDLDAYHLGGHGCAASTMSIFLARQLLLAVRPAARTQVIGLGCHLVCTAAPPARCPSSWRASCCSRCVSQPEHKS